MRLIRFVGIIQLVGIVFLALFGLLEKDFESLIYVFLVLISSLLLVFLRKPAITFSIVLNIITTPIFISNSFQYAVIPPTAIYYLNTHHELKFIGNKTKTDKKVKFIFSFVGIAFIRLYGGSILGYGINFLNILNVVLLVLGRRYPDILRSKKSPMAVRRRLRVR
ncbi:hypothetical protein GCM10011352_41880 [Marinobacterium zhoushanense]|uniref:Uncharacterized protein n=1 Tax=Marinobacterium zhoushanense TaxID=1679163 RepID=A0ABQ1KZ82_9GAMM|nr:hypothetical protein [Marinobacterium zhoushanense]GGC11002.1 hypothetical protein GCM10011352_41880 [Marinobacterium zhoushanense]